MPNSCKISSLLQHFIITAEHKDHKIRIYLIFFSSFYMKSNRDLPNVLLR